jgi:type I restriction enzyme S subunit
MTVETFFEKFDQFADAPDAVSKMRDMVLQLAVTGKLVAQDTRDEPTSVLLDSTKKARSIFVAAGKIKDRQLSVNDPGQKLFTLPGSWRWARLLDVGYELGQKIPDKRFTYIDVGSIDSEQGCISDRVEELEPNEAPSRARKLVVRGTVIYSTVRPYLLNIAIIDQNFSSEPIASTAFGILHPFEGIYNRYLFYWLRSRPFIVYVQQVMKGMAYPAINDEKFYNGFIALPPTAEQKRIVEKVDELMALCDQLEQQQQEREAKHATLAHASLARFAEAPTTANLNFLFHKSYDISPEELRRTILNLAVRGKLVPQDSEEEPAAASIEIVASDARKAVSAGILKKRDKLEQLQSSKLSELPLGWRWSCLSDISLPVPHAIKRGPFGSAIRKDMFVSQGYKVYEQQHAISSDFTIGHYYISEAKFQELRSFELHPGEILVSCSGTVGRVAIVPPSIERGVINQALLKLALHQAAMVNEYFIILFPAFFMQTDTLLNLQGTAQKNIPGMSILRRMPFPLPPIAEQKRIVTKVDTLMAMVDKLEEHIANSAAIGEDLLEAVVAELTSVN